MEFVFGSFGFELAGDKILLTQTGNFAKNKRGFCEVQIAGENRISHMGVKMVYSSDGERLKYVSPYEKDGVLTIVQKSDLVETSTIFTKYGDCDAIRIKTLVKNISDAPFVLEEVSDFVLQGIGSTTTPDIIYHYVGGWRESKARFPLSAAVVSFTREPPLPPRASQFPPTGSVCPQLATTTLPT